MTNSSSGGGFDCLDFEILLTNKNLCPLVIGAQFDVGLRSVQSRVECNGHIEAQQQILTLLVPILPSYSHEHKS